jgi:Cu2+-exporting ATPase
MAARNGFLVRQRAALEAARNIDTVLFDKTGTLTKGEYGVTDVWSANNGSREEVLRLAASVDVKSEHAVARAIVRVALEEKAELVEVNDFKRLPGKGVSGALEGRKISVGGQALLQEAEIELTKEIQQKVKEAGDAGKTIIYVLEDNGLMGVIALGDIVREESREAVKKLKEQGIEVAMVTGDSEGVAQWVARELGIDTVFSQVLPEHKSDKVKELQDQGKKVAMVCDGY